MNQKKKSKRKIVLIITILLIVIGLLSTPLWKERAASIQYVTSPVENGSLRRTITATGTLQAVTTVQVGSQVSGTISALNADYNSRVHKGQVIAQLDPSVLQAQVASAQANLKAAQASLADALARKQAALATIENQRSGVSAAVANVDALKAQRDDAANSLQRQQQLLANGVVAQQTVDTARTTWQAAEARYRQSAAQLNQAQVAEDSAKQAGLAQAEAQVMQAQAQIQQSEASLNQAQVNLSHTTITSPVDGVVVSRAVDVGQTVAASLQAPQIFTIANDLSKMQVIANIDQADIGEINTQNTISFTVDAYPDKTFAGTINQIRLSPQTVSNVVTYNVMINVDNPEEKLMPGMTANLIVTTSSRDKVLKIPNSALRFNPQAVLSRSNSPEGSPQIITGTEVTAENDNEHTVWVLTANHKAEARKIQIGVTDSISTEVISGDLHAGEQVIISQKQKGSK